MPKKKIVEKKNINPKNNIATVLKTLDKKKLSSATKQKKEFPRIKGILSNTEQALVNKPKKRKKIFKKIKIIGRNTTKVIKKIEKYVQHTWVSS